MKNPASPQAIEPRWPPGLTIFLVMVLVTVLPDRIRFLPAWVPYIPGIAVLAAMGNTVLTGATARSRRVERLITLIFCIGIGGWALISLAYLVHEMVNPSKALTGLQLLSSSIAIWLANVLTFSLLYWQIDRGGPEARVHHSHVRPDWLFPQTGVPEEAPPDWRPTFIDYLFLAFSTATAFSPTDALPLTTRAKLMMMLESSISLATIVVIASRAINILGS